MIKGHSKGSIVLHKILKTLSIFFSHVIKDFCANIFARVRSILIVHARNCAFYPCKNNTDKCYNNISAYITYKTTTVGMVS